LAPLTPSVITLGILLKFYDDDDAVRNIDKLMVSGLPMVLVMVYLIVVFECKLVH